MAAVWYTGTSDKRIIRDTDWTILGTSGPTVTWDKSNGFSQPVSGFSAGQLTALAAMGEFNTNAPDGPRTSVVRAPTQRSILGGSTAPADRSALWLDESSTPAVLRSWNGTMWAPQGPCAGSLEQRLDITQLWAANAASPMTIPTYDGSNETVEPAVRYIPGGWNGHKWWMVVTPYPSNNDQYENPQVFYSDDGDTWTAVPGAPAPLMGPPADGHNDDPEFIIGPDGLMYVFIMSSHPTTTDVSVFSSPDGVNWTGPTVVLSTSKSAESILAPCVDYDGTQWVMWTVDISNGYNSVSAPYAMWRRTAPSALGPWSNKTAVTINGLNGRSPWESHIHRVGREWHMTLTTVSILGNGSDSQLYAGVSRDGLTFTLSPTQLLYPSASPGWDSNIIYRADFVPLVDGGDGVWDLFYSARKGSGGSSVWKSGRTTVRSGGWDPKPLVSRLTADATAVNNSNVLADSGLSLSGLTPGAVYEFTGFIEYIATTTADLKLSLVLPSGATGFITPNALRAAATAASDTIQRQLSSTLTNLTLGGTGGNAVAIMEGTIVMGATTGTIKVQFAQSVAEASDAKILAGSYLKLARVA